MDKSTVYVDYDNFEAYEDFTHLSEHECTHKIINLFITLASKTGHTIEEEIEGCLEGHRQTKARARLFGGF